jgi:DNA-binding SARP family transcriptional activator
LIFNSHEVVQEKRTSLDLSPDDSLCFTKNFKLEFDINFVPGRQIYFGYVVRIIGNDNQNIDLIYNQPSASFKVIVGENFSGISFTVDSVRLRREWNHFSLTCDLEHHTLQFDVNGKPAGSSALSVHASCFKFLWGANDFQKFKTRDIPPMRIKDIRIRENEALKYSWPLDDTAGVYAYDKVSKRVAKIENPVWLKPKYQEWELVSSFTMQGYAGVAFDAKRDRLYITGSDSLGVYGFRNDQAGIDRTPFRRHELLLGHQAIYDTTGDRLYEIYVDQKKIAAYDFKSQHWNIDFAPGPLTEFWHANKFIAADTSLYYIGGYGQLRYKNTVQRYHFAEQKWDTVKASGDYFSPRYLAALGADPQGKFAYIIGGYGSQTGDQMLDPKNYYDLFRYDVKAVSFKRIFSLKPLATPFTFANSLVVDAGANAWYGLIFPDDRYNSNLQLIGGSLSDSAFRLLAKPIPYSFHDVQSFADLYYSPLSNKLIAVTLLYTAEEAREKNTEVKIYTLNFPPGPAETAAAIPAEPRSSSGFFLFLLPGLTIIAIIAILLFRRRRIQAAKTIASTPAAAGEEVPLPAGAPYLQEPVEKSHRPAIYLFGQFQVFDKEGNDITRLFTPLLKELFLIIATYTIRNGKGISSEGLNEILWHDKPGKDAKNNRSVNLAKLKTIFEKIGNCCISKEPDYWQFQVPDEDIFFDYKKYASLLQRTAEPAKAYIHPLVDIIRRGAFLSRTEYNWLDDIKSEISTSTIDLCLAYIKSHDNSKDLEFIVEIANCIFYFDALNEDALTYKCKSLILLKRHTLANNAYLKFVKEFKDIYGTDFGKSFQEVIL